MLNARFFANRLLSPAITRDTAFDIRRELE
jgi:hypothetical protein